MRLSLVIPCYNEAENLPLLLSRCQATLQAHPCVDIVLVDNGSTDATPELLRANVAGNQRLTQLRVAQNLGYGYGILSGLKAAKGDIIGWTHADLQTDPLDCLKAIDIFERSSEPEKLFVKGQRYGRKAADVFFTVGMSCFETALLRKPLWDINAQPTLFHRDFWATWEAPPHDFSLDLYAYYLASERRMTIKRFPVEFAKRAHGHSHWNVNWASKWRFIKRTVTFSMALKRQHQTKRVAL